MRKTMIALLAATIAFGALAGPVAAKKKKKKAKPVAHTLYFHGTQPSGEAYYADSVASSLGFQKMDPNEPTDPAPKSMGITNYVVGPNTSCSGNSLFPTWEGSVIGAVSGDLTVYLNAIGHAATTVRVDVFADSTGGCDSSLGSTGYVPPVATQDITLSPGPAENEIVFEDVKFNSLANIVVMITPVDGAAANDPTSQGRVLYDSADFASRIEFMCAPTSGKTCTP